MRNRPLYGFVSAAVALAFAVLARPLPAEESAAGEPDYAYGTVARVADGEIVVAEYDYTEDRDVEVSYGIDGSVQLENVGSLEEIAKGDIVDVIFVTRGNKKVATSIAVEKPVPPQPIELPERAPADTEGRENLQPAG